MRLLEAWIATPLAQAMGWTLLDSLWQGAIIAAGLAASLAAMRSPRARYAAACVAMLVMLAGMAFTLARLMPGGAHVGHSYGAFPLPKWTVGPSPDGAAPPTRGLAAIVPWLASVWMVGVWILALRQVGAWISISRLRRRGVCCAPQRWQEELRRLSRLVRLTRPVALLESCLAEVPMVVGYVRPVILMPIGLLAGLSSGQIEAILLHELAHIRRHDYLVNLLQRVAESLLFYHPAVWWISRVIRTERENCCDDLAVAASGDVRQYAMALAALEQNRWPGRTPAVAATGGSLVKRIRRLLYPRSATGLWTPLFAAAVLVATAVVALAAWPPGTPRQGSEAQPVQSNSADTSAYTKWLNEEVTYIITDEERAAFEKLATDEERADFVKRFWERRNPNPGSSENEFKEEYYRRLAFVNQRYSASKPGWKTDRGHMYIIWGPPEEVDSHPANQPYPYEVWTYHYIEGLGNHVSFTFVDKTGRGNFALSSPPWKSSPTPAPAQRL